MALSNPFQTVLEGLLDDLNDKKGINSPFHRKIKQIQDIIEKRIANPPKSAEEIFDSLRRLSNQKETAPFFTKPPIPRPDPNRSPEPAPAIRNPRFRPNIPTPQLGGSTQVQGGPPADTKLAQAGPETMTDAPSAKPLQAPPDLVNAVITQESGGNPNAVSIKGAIGLMQIMPATATDPGFGIAPIPVEKLTNAAANKKFGTEYLSAMLNRYNGDTRKALIAYNAGHTVADRFNGDLSSLPAETQNYVARIEATLGKRAAEAQSAPETPAGAPSAVPAAPTPATPPVAPQTPSADRTGPSPAPDINLGPMSMAQGTSRRPIVPVLWAQFLESRDPKDLVSVPKSDLPAILALLGQVARRPR